MSKVNFNYDVTKDAWSWALIAKDKNMWGLNWRDQIAQIPDELLEKIENADSSYAQKIIKEYIENDPKKEYKNKVMYSEMRTLEKVWRIIERKYFKILSEIMQKLIFLDVIDCYFTTGFVCIDNGEENWFMVSMWHSIPFSITNVCHEIMHLQFLNGYKDYLKEKGLKNNQIEDIKESLTFLLNEPEFDKIILCQDAGYPEHERLRNRMKSIWQEDKNFQRFLDKAIGITKEEFPNREKI
ncbi:MAG: hypothetical protein V1860_02585 [bacterium]